MNSPFSKEQTRAAELIAQPADGFGLGRIGVNDITDLAQFQPVGHRLREPRRWSTDDAVSAFPDMNLDEAVFFSIQSV